jgi:hypothetical protein
MPDYPSVPGFRIVGDRPKPARELSYAYLELKTEAAHALDKLRKSVKENGANCVGRADEFSGDSDTLLTGEDAELACASCKSWTACDIYRLVARPAHGVYAGVSKNFEIEGEQDGKS